MLQVRVILQLHLNGRKPLKTQTVIQTELNNHPHELTNETVQEKHA